MRKRSSMDISLKSTGRDGGSSASAAGTGGIVSIDDAFSTGGSVLMLLPFAKAEKDLVSDSISSDLLSKKLSVSSSATWEIVLSISTPCSSISIPS